MPFPLYFVTIFVIIANIILLFKIIKKLFERKFDTYLLKVIVALMILSFILFTIFSWVNIGARDRDYLNSLSKNEIVEILVYQADLNTSKTQKGTFLFSLRTEEKINLFIDKYWRDLKKSFDHAFGKTYILEIKTKKGNMIFEIVKSHISNYVKIILIAKFNESIIGIMNFKSEKLYNFLKLIEKREKELKNNNGDN